MAIDTANKRGSSFLDECGILFPPDATIAAPDRIWLVGWYSGIAGGTSGFDGCIELVNPQVSLSSFTDVSCSLTTLTAVEANLPEATGINAC